MDELIAEKSISAAHNSLLPGPKGGKKKDLSDLIVKLEKDREIRRKELLTMLTELSNQEDMLIVYGPVIWRWTTLIIRC